MPIDTAEFRQRQRKMWTSGDWPEVAKTIQPVADELVEKLDIAEGQDVLDNGTGSGNAALAAAQRGAKVTGSDISPEFFDTARARARSWASRPSGSRATPPTFPLKTIPLTSSPRSSAACSPRSTSRRPTSSCA